MVTLTFKLTAVVRFFVDDCEREIEQVEVGKYEYAPNSSSPFPSGIRVLAFIYWLLASHRIIFHLHDDENARQQLLALLLQKTAAIT